MNIINLTQVTSLLSQICHGIIETNDKLSLIYNIIKPKDVNSSTEPQQKEAVKEVVCDYKSKYSYDAHHVIPNLRNIYVAYGHRFIYDLPNEKIYNNIVDRTITEVNLYTYALNLNAILILAEQNKISLDWLLTKHKNTYKTEINKPFLNMQSYSYYITEEE